jgi:hypothetical protein
LYRPAKLPSGFRTFASLQILFKASPLKWLQGSVNLPVAINMTLHGRQVLGSCHLNLSPNGASRVSKIQMAGRLDGAVAEMAFTVRGSVAELRNENPEYEKYVKAFEGSWMGKVLDLAVTGRRPLTFDEWIMGKSEANLRVMVSVTDIFMPTPLFLAI